MARAGDFMDVELKEVHLGWGTRPATRNRNEYEAYIPIPAGDARRLSLFNRNNHGCDYSVTGKEFTVFAGGSQGPNKAYGKNFESRGDITLLGHYLRDELNAQVGNVVRVYWVTNTEVQISIVR